MAAQLLDAGALAQLPARGDRARAAHWALHPAPLGTTREAPPALQLTALTLATHTSGQSGNAEADLLTRLCGLSLARVEDLLDRLLHTAVLAGWHHAAETGELRWHLPDAGLEIA